MPQWSHSAFLIDSICSPYGLPSVVCLTSFGSGFVIPRSGYPSTFLRTISVTIFGFALPWLAFMAWPVNQFMAFSLPA